MADAPAIDTLTAEHLAAPLRRLWGDAAARVVDWQVTPMKGGVGNPVSAGLYRLQVTGRAGEETRAGTLVLKVVQSPANLGMLDLGGGADQRHWNYWAREPLFYGSDLPARLPDGLVAPACYGVTRWANDVAWLWLEAVRDRYDGGWQLPQLQQVARQLGRLNGRFTDPARRPAAPWLSTDAHRQLLHGAFSRNTPLFDAAGEPRWQHPLLQAMFGAAAGQPYRDFWAARERLLARLDDLPLTWCHGDAAPGNFMLRAGSGAEDEVVALDWALTGIGPLGNDLAQLVYGRFYHFDESNREAAIQALFDSYLAGLADAGWQGDPRLVWLGYALTVLIKFGQFILFIMGLGLDAPAAGDTPAALDPAQRAAAQLLNAAAAQALALAAELETG